MLTTDNEYTSKSQNLSAPVVSESEVCLSKVVSRDLALDVVKGLCVLVMILYHSIGYFRGSALNLKYLAFVTGAFIFLAGFVATSIYLQKYDARSQWRIIFTRLVSRGLKLVLLAFLLNLFIMMLLPGGKWKHDSSIYTMLWNLLSGRDYHAVSFDLLVLIGYCLIAIAVLLALGRGRKGVLVCAAVSAVVYAFVSDHNRWQGNYYSRLFAIGQMGAMVGLLRLETIQRIASHFEVVLLFYFGQLLLLVLWAPSYLVYLLSLFGTLLAMYSIGAKFDPKSWLCKKVILLGQYSLLSYLFQIAFLQVLRRLDFLSEEQVLIAFLLTCLATFGCVELVHQVRQRVRLVEGTYRFVFS